MFKKKQTKEVLQAKEQDTLYYDEVEIRAAMKCLNDALKTGQIVNRYTTSKPTLVVVSECEGVEYENGFQVSTHFLLPILDQMEIKSKEAIEKEVKDKKQKELEKLMECQSKDLKEIERLARELGESEK